MKASESSLICEWGSGLFTGSIRAVSMDKVLSLTRLGICVIDLGRCSWVFKLVILIEEEVFVE